MEEGKETENGHYFLGVLWVSSLITDEKMGAPGDKEHTSSPKTRKLKSQISNPSLSDPKVLAFLLLLWGISLNQVSIAAYQTTQSQSFEATISIYCLIVSVSQEFKNSLVGWFWPRVCWELQSRYQLRLELSTGSTGAGRATSNCQVGNLVLVIESKALVPLLVGLSISWLSILTAWRLTSSKTSHLREGVPGKLS